MGLSGDLRRPTKLDVLGSFSFRFVASGHGLLGFLTYCPAPNMRCIGCNGGTPFRFEFSGELGSTVIESTIGVCGSGNRRLSGMPHSVGMGSIDTPCNSLTFALSRKLARGRACHIIISEGVVSISNVSVIRPVSCAFGTMSIGMASEAINLSVRATKAFACFTSNDANVASTDASQGASGILFNSSSNTFACGFTMSATSNVTYCRAASKFRISTAGTVNVRILNSLANGRI